MRERLPDELTSLQQDAESFFHGLLGEEEEQRDWDRDDLWNMDDYEFEKLVAELWEDMGYETNLTQQKRDLGVDVIAESSVFGPFGAEKLAIQVKQYQGSISSGDVHKLAGAYRRSKYEADAGLFVTSSHFTGPAEDAEEDLNIELIDGSTLVEYLNESSVTPPEF